MSNSDQNSMVKFCRSLVPEVLVEVCDIEPSEAHRIGEYMLARAQAFAALERADQQAIAAPFVEDVFAYDPIEGPIDIKAAVAVVVRNSRIEDAHANGPVNSGGIKALTAMAVAPLSELLETPCRDLDMGVQSNPFSGLQAAYPRTWAALSALRSALNRGGRVGYRAPNAPIPVLPEVEEVRAVRISENFKGAAVESGTDEVINEHLVQALQFASQEQAPFYTPCLSRISRNSHTLHLVLEFLLSHKVPVVTTNYLIRPSDVWVRTGGLVRVDTKNFGAGLSDLSGISGSHRKVIEMIRDSYSK